MSDEHGNPGTTAAQQAVPPLSAPTTLMEGFITGIIGAGVVAAWFLLLDTIQHVPLWTPSLLGTVLFKGAHAAAEHNAVDPGMVAAYTLVHHAAFIGVGLVQCSHAQNVPDPRGLMAVDAATDDGERAVLRDRAGALSKLDEHFTGNVGPPFIPGVDDAGDRRRRHQPLIGGPHRLSDARQVACRQPHGDDRDEH